MYITSWNIYTHTHTHTHKFVSDLAFDLTWFSESVDLIPQFDIDLSLVSGISSRLLASCRLSHTWCTTKMHHSLASGNTKTYLFLSNTDLRVSSTTAYPPATPRLISSSPIPISG